MTDLQQAVNIAWQFIHIHSSEIIIGVIVAMILAGIKCIVQDIIRNCPFFSDPQELVGENFTKHHDEIKQVYRNWQHNKFHS